MVIIDSTNKDSKKLIKYTIEGILNNEKNTIILFIDEEKEYSSIIDIYNGKKIFCNHITRPYLEQFVNKKTNFYMLELDSPVAYNLKEIKRIEIEITKMGYESFIILNTSDISLLDFIRKYYKTDLKDFYK